MDNVSVTERVHDMGIIRRWKFWAEVSTGGFYLAADGRCDVDEAEWIGTDHEAEVECERRADLYEENTGITVESVEYQSQGKVKE
jgi:hypothetical protein